MDAKVWSAMKPILANALALPLPDRPAFIAWACEGRHDLRDCALSLLREPLGDFLDSELDPVSTDDSMVELHGVLGRQMAGWCVVRLLARGGMGAVYLAHRHDDHERRAAIKIPFPGDDPDSANRSIEREYDFLKRLDHPCVVRPMGLASLDDLVCLVMEHVDGMPLDAYCDVHRLGVAERIDLVMKLCAAVEHVHERGVIHNDIKPANVLVCEAGRPTLVDFGIASVRTPAGNTGCRPRRERKARAGRVERSTAFTIECASPEQFRNQSPGPGSDVYALGLLLYRLLTGRHPQEPFGPASMIQRLLSLRRQVMPPSALVRMTGAPRSMPITSREVLAAELEAGLDHVVARALARDPAQRHQSAAALRADLLAIRY